MAADGSIDLQPPSRTTETVGDSRPPQGGARQLDWLSTAAPIATPEGIRCVHPRCVGDRGRSRLIALRTTTRAPLRCAGILDPTSTRLNSQTTSVAIAKRTSDADHLVAHNLSGADAFVTMERVDDPRSSRSTSSARRQGSMAGSEAVAMVEATVVEALQCTSRSAVRCVGSATTNSTPPTRQVAGSAEPSRRRSRYGASLRRRDRTVRGSGLRTVEHKAVVCP